MFFAQTIASTEIVTALRITKVTPDGAATVIFDGFPDGSTSSRPKNDANKGFRVALAATGDFYVSDSYMHAIYKITPTGKASLIAGKPGEAGSSD